METAIINGIFGLLGVVVAVILEEYLRRRWFGRTPTSSYEKRDPVAKDTNQRSARRGATQSEPAQRASAPDRGRPYEKLQQIVEELGGQMRYEKLGRPQGGTWIVSLPGHTEKFFDSSGAGFPLMDQLHVPKVPNPSHYRDYSNDLLPDARDRWISLLRSS